ncbi:riboflavin biosynthesis protein RibF [bacterium]|nr:MAG: riboflavin biosynthesis protein RibF [bacterium]
MRIIRDLNRVRKFKTPVVAIGVFDGLHLGHGQILKSVVKKAKDVKGTSVVITFYPHPQKEYDIYSLEHRLKLIKEAGIDVCFVVSFNKAFENMQPEEFIRRILVDKIAAKYIFVGDNFVFGKRARGNIKLLEDYSSLYGFKIKAIRLLNKNKKAVSSTLIRKLIRQGRLKKAEELLGRRVSILGRVVKGFSLGRRIGFPTANINPQHDIIPPAGIYAVKVFLKDKEYAGVCYIGDKPTFKIKHKRI